MAEAAVNATSTQQETPKATSQNYKDIQWRINDPSPSENETSSEGSSEGAGSPVSTPAKEKSISEIIDNVVAKEKPVVVLGRAAKPIDRETPLEGEESTPQKRRVKFEGKEIEVDDGDEATRLIQEGLLHRKKNYEIARQAKEIQAREAKAFQQEEELKQAIEAIKTNGLEVLAQIQGEEVARRQAEAWLRPRIEREMMPEEQQKILYAEDRAQQAEAQLKQYQEQQKQSEISAQTKQYFDHYNKVIIDALEKTSTPKTEFTAKEMAGWIELGLKKGIEYTPEQLAQLVKEDNNMRVQSLVGHHVQQITQARTKKDMNMVVKHGEALTQLLGEPVMYAVGAYLVHRKNGMSPTQPKQILDTPKTKSVETVKRSGYMTEDEAKAERLRRVNLLEQGIDPGEWV